MTDGARRHFLQTTGWATAALATPAWAQGNAPLSPLRIVVGFPPGGTADVLARVLAERFTADLGRPVIVDNKPGAAGRLAANEVKRATPDGNTLMLAPVVVTVLAPLVYPSLSYTAADFAPVGHVADFNFGIAVHPSNPARSVPELMAIMKRDPALANFSSAAAGSLPHFFGVMLAQKTATPMVHVPFNGSAPMMNALMGGQITAAINEVGGEAEFHRAGRIRVLGVFSPRRDPLLPDVPTVAEQGIAGVQGAGWYGLYAPRATPAAMVARLNQALDDALRSDRVRDALQRISFQPAGGSPQALTQLELTETARWAPVIKASGFKAD